MEDYTSDALRTVQQAADEFSMETGMNPEVHENNEISQEPEKESAVACSDSIINEPETITSVVSSSVLESELLTEIRESLNESPPSSEKVTNDESTIGSQTDLQKAHDSTSNIVDSIEKDVKEPVEDENRMDTSDNISQKISTDSIPLTKDLSEEKTTDTLEVSSDQNDDSNEITPSTSDNKPFESAKQAVSISEISNVESFVSQELGETTEDSTALKVTESLSEIPSESFPELEPQPEKLGNTPNDANTNTVENVVETADKMDTSDGHGTEINITENVENIVSTSTEDNEKIIEETDKTQCVSGSNETDISDQNKSTENNKEIEAASTTVPEAGLSSSSEPEKNDAIEKSTDSMLNKEKAVSERENTEFVQVNTENEKELETEKDEEINSRRIIEHDPIASDTFESTNSELHEGADEELCIIPDTQREISQAERDAASSIPPLRDLIEASASSQTDDSSEPMVTDQSSGSTIVYKYEKEDLQICNECKLKRKVKYHYSITESEMNFLCDDNCLNDFKSSQQERVALNWEEGSLRVKNFSGVSKEPPSLSFIRKCAACKKITDDIENNLTWEIMDFCNEFCITKYQKETGSHCSSCQGEVKSNCLGKYCVRFGNDIRQFCTSVCLEKYKKGLKVCSYCQQDMSGGTAGFVAPVGDKGQIKDFCTELCMEKYDVMTNNRPPKVVPGTMCSVCKGVKPITIEFELDGSPNYFCGEPCFVAFSFVNNISPGKCAMCRRHFPKSTLEKYTMYYDNVQHSFCSNSCENIYIIAHRKIVPCSWCKVKKYNFDMIRRYSKTGPMINMCSVNCLSLYRVSLDTVSSRQSCCNFCQKVSQPTHYLTMSDSTTRNFCSYNCVLAFQNQFHQQPISLNNLGDSTFPVPIGAPKKSKAFPDSDSPGPMGDVPQLPVISSVQSLASTNGSLGSPQPLPPTLAPIQTINTRSTRSKSTTNPPIMNSSPQVINSFSEIPFQVQIKQHFIVRPAPLPEQKNVGTMCYTKKANKSTMMKPIMVDEEIQTEEREAQKILIPVPVPIYVPTPMHMFSVPTPVPVPFPVPIPIPIFIPTTRNSAAGIMKEIKKIQVKIPTDPYEAELLMMAEMVAEEKKEDLTDSESDVDDTGGPEDSYSPEPVDANNTFGDDMLQMALKMATELDEPAVDLEGALTANTITAPQGGEPHGQEENVDDPQPMHHHMMDRSPSVRGRKRGMRQPRGGGAKRGRRMSHQQVDIPLMQHQVQQAPPPPEPTEKPDANMCLKYTFGVNAWKQWVTTKNTELEKSSRRVKLFKTEILQLTADELNYSLCLFVKEVRKPNGAEYAPDTIYYLCLGIQQYLFENGRIENIFCDPYYEKFTDCLDEVAKKFSVLYNDSHYIVTRVEEEHLWESKQLGAHSPHVLLSTLMFFNTKHFNLTSVDEHMQLSFSHIMKHWKRNPNQPGASKVPGSRNVLLRFYPPQSAIQNNARKKKVYEQQENEENPLRCPVKLYEFYLSKCPESVKTRNDVFYLQPERSCVPDSPVWYSTMPLPKEALEKMLHRVKMVKEINVALLTS